MTAISQRRSGLQGTRVRACLALALATAFTLALAPAPGSAAGLRPVPAEHGMVVSVHRLASSAGVRMMQDGGNAVDAAVATAFALAVVHPAAGNLGGGGFMLLRLKDGSTHFLDFRETAPAAATATMYQDAHGNIVPDLSTLGYKAVGVPGSVKGLVYAEEHFGRLGLEHVLQPAIRLAREGYALSFGEAQDMSSDTGLARFPDSRRIFQNGGRGWRAGDMFRQPQLARTLERIAAAPDDFYTGSLARELAAYLRHGGGLITLQDLAQYRVRERVPVEGRYRGLTVISAPPPSSGGIALLEALNILEGYDLAAAGLDSASSVHLITEAYRRAFFDRAQFLGDPDYSNLPVRELLDKSYAAAWRRSIQPDRASPSLTLRRPPVSAELARYAAAHPVLPGPEPTHTTHFSVVDAAGNAVAVTTTLNDWYGSRVTVGPLGFLLNDEMDDFSSKPGAPNMYGLLQSEANAIGPRKRPLSAMTPTIVVRGGAPWLVLGSPGGPTIITTVADVLINVADYGLDIQAAVNAPRFHHQWMPDDLVLEPRRFSPDTVKLLQAMGHHITYDIDTDAECIEVDPKTGIRWGASDGRNENGAAMGY
ncbi:MAG TPA: gamma-glutamyltransferase [Steroidobacteraceae bacterium]|nr:gamma-glutamyltransferase [Steroidobacteraceae bacterium]